MITTGIIFLLITVSWFITEAASLAKNTDANQPYTYYVRKILGNPFSITWWIGVGLIGWLGCHFLAYAWLPC